MNEQELQAIEERAKRADGTNITNAIHDSDGCTHADYTFVEWALEDVLALIAEVRSLRAKMDAVGEYANYYVTAVLLAWAGDNAPMTFDEWLADAEQEEHMIPIWQAVVAPLITGGVGVAFGMAIMAACAAAHYDDDMQGRE